MNTSNASVIPDDNVFIDRLKISAYEKNVPSRKNGMVFFTLI